METTYDQSNVRHLGIALLLAIGLHCVALYGFLHIPYGLAPNREETRPIQIRLLPRSQNGHESPISMEPVLRPTIAPGSSEKAKSASIIGSAQHFSSNPSVEAHAEQSEPRLDLNAILTNVHRDIAAIDREVRQDHPNQLASLSNTAKPSKLESSIAAAGKPRSITTETIILADGRRMAKVRGPNGTYCVTLESASGLDGQDHMQNGVRVKTTNCPG